MGEGVEGGECGGVGVWEEVREGEGVVVWGCGRVGEASGEGVTVGA